MGVVDTYTQPLWGFASFVDTTSHWSDDEKIVQNLPAALTQPKSTLKCSRHSPAYKHSTDTYKADADLHHQKKLAVESFLLGLII